jgi:hypothetical protein
MIPISRTCTKAKCITGVAISRTGATTPAGSQMFMAWTYANLVDMACAQNSNILTAKPSGMEAGVLLEHFFFKTFKTYPLHQRLLNLFFIHVGLLSANFAELYSHGVLQVSDWKEHVWWPWEMVLHSLKCEEEHVPRDIQRLDAPPLGQLPHPKALI